MESTLKSVQPAPKGMPSPCSLNRPHLERAPVNTDRALNQFRRHTYVT